MLSFPTKLLKRICPRKARHYISVGDFGAKGSGQTNDRAAFQKAIDKAVAEKLPLYVPSSKQPYLIQFDATTTKIQINGDLVMFGDGKNYTTIKFGPDRPEFDYSGFFVENGVNFELRDLRMVGPISRAIDWPTEIDENVNKKPGCFEVFGLFFNAGPHNHRVIIEKVDIDGFFNCVYAQASDEQNISEGNGELFVTMRDCNLQPGYQSCVLFFSDTHGHKRLHMYNCYLHDNQYSHLVYCHPHNSVHIENCRFNGADKWAWQFQGTSVEGYPEYQRFVGCWFGPNNTQGIITYGNDQIHAQVQIIGCTFQGSPSVQISSNVIIDGCNFTTNEVAGNAPFVSAYSGSSSWSAILTNCTFKPQVPKQPQVDFRFDNVQVVISDCQFYNSHISNGMLAVGGENCNTVISNCQFISEDIPTSQDSAIQIAGGVTQISGCQFSGRFIHDRGVIWCVTSETQPTTNSRIEVNNCLFNSITRGSIVHVADEYPEKWSWKLFGHNNAVHNLTSKQHFFSIFPHADAPVFGRFSPQSGVSDPSNSITASSIIKVNSNYDTFYVNGTAHIETINWWDDGGNSNKLFSGKIHLIFEDSFMLLDTGNIQPINPAQHSAGKIVELVYIPDTDLWLEI